MGKEIANTIHEQSALIDRLVLIGKEQYKDIDNNVEAATSNDEIDAINKGVIIYTQSLYIKSFFDLVDFLNKKIIIEDDDSCIFYLPSLRTLFDLYGELLYLCNINKIKRGAVCMSYSMFILSRRYNFSVINSSDSSLIEPYDNYFNHYKSFFDKYNYDIPVDIKYFSKGKLKALGLLFPEKIDIFNKKYFEECSVQTRGVFKFECNFFYNNYRWLSDYVHGNLYSILKFKGKKYNERLWIITKQLVLSMLMIELVNKKIIDNKRKNELNDWISEYRKKIDEFIKYWLTQKSR